MKKLTKEEALKKIKELEDYINNMGNTYKKYDEKVIAGNTYFVLDYNEEKKEVTYCMKDIMSKENVKKYFTDEWYVDSDCDVRFNSDIRNNRYEDSYIYKVLNGAFKKDKLKDLDVVGDVRLLTKEEVLNLDIEHKKTSRYGHWTMTPYNDMNELDSGDYAYVFYVWGNGALHWDSVDGTCGVRPVITLSTESLE